MTQPSKKMSRRDALKILGAAAGASVLANLPSRWSTPQLASGVLPAHAQTSGVLPVVETVTVVSLVAPIGFNVSSIAPRGNGLALANARFTGKSTDDGGQPILANGFVYSNSNAVPVLGSDTGVLGTPNPAAVGIDFTADVYLAPAPTWYVRAYATNAVGTGYGGVKTLNAVFD